jgi:hypothetical protein
MQITSTVAIAALTLSLVPGCGSKRPIAAASPTSITPVGSGNYQRLFDSVGDRCYAGDHFPTEAALGPNTNSIPWQNSDKPDPSIRLAAFAQNSFLHSGRVYSNAFLSTSAETPQSPQKRGISSVEDLSLLSDVISALLKKDDLIVIGPPARGTDRFRPDDWYAVFRSLAGVEAPGVTIDPGPNPMLMQVRYFGGIQQTELGSTFFEADRTLKLLSTGFDNATCALWPDRPRNVPTELDLIGSEIGDGARPIAGQGAWHRFWFEPSQNYVESEGSHVLIPKNRLLVKDESIPPGTPSPKSARDFAESISAHFFAMAERIPAFRELQRDAGLVMLAKWMRDKQFPADEGWISRMPEQTSTPSNTPSITVLRAKLTDQYYLRYGIHGGVDFQKDNQYGPPSPQMRRLIQVAEQSEPSGASSWVFSIDGQPYRAVRLKIRNPVQIRPRWVVWQRAVTRTLAQPGVYRAIVPLSNFVVTNDMDEPLTLQIIGPLNKTERVAPGSPTVVRVVPGAYRLQMTSKCGNKSDTVKVSKGERHQIRYWCQPERTRPAPVQARGGSFVVNNNTGATLTVNVGGLSYTIAPGTSTIPLAPGNYTATITSRCGSVNETLNVSDGSTYTGQYTCVLQ